MVGRRPSLVRTWVWYRVRALRERQLGPFRNARFATMVLATVDLIRLAKWRLLGLPSQAPVMTVDRYQLLDVAIDAAPPRGLWLEFGVLGGNSINYISQRTRQPLFGFDSFEGFPRRWQPWFPAATYSAGGVLPEVNPGVTLIKGWFDQTIPSFLQARPDDRVAFLHVDCDLYSSARTVLAHLGHRIINGTVVVFDEFCGAMPDDEARAWREFCRENRVTFRWIGCSLPGAVAVQVTSTVSSQK